MRRVALFFDGKNHMRNLQRAADDRWLDHGALAAWMVEHVGGTHMVAAHYYTGIPTAHDDVRERNALSDLLEEMERRPGFFVHRFNRRTTSRECPHCAEVITYTEEKMVDTSLVADMVTHAARDNFDIAVVFSGDLDIAPGLDALLALGKQAWIATFGDDGLSRSLAPHAWSRVDLLQHIEHFSFADIGRSIHLEPVLEEATPEQVDSEILRELRRAEAHFAAGGGFVGAHYFIHRWKGHSIPDAPEERRMSLQRLMATNDVEAYAVDGKTALRAFRGAPPKDEPTDLTRKVEPPEDDEERTLEIRVPETVRRIGRRRRLTDDDNE